MSREQYVHAVTRVFRAADIWVEGEVGRDVKEVGRVDFVLLPGGHLEKEHLPMLSGPAG